MADRLELEARFNDKASAGVKKLGKTLGEVKPTSGMAAASKWMGEFRSAADKANVAVRPIATGLSAVGIGGLAASLSMGELVKQFKDLADSTLTMRELGRQSRMSATEISRLQYAAGKLHVDPAAVGGAISSWSSKMVEFRMHTSEFYRYLMRQNADVAAKIQSDNPVDALKDSLDYLSRIKDPQIQKRVADMAGLGDLTPMLGKGPQGLAEAFADAAREVKPISAELQQAADRFNDATNRFNQSWSNLKNDIGPSVIDPLARTIDKLDEGLKFAAQFPGDAAAAAATIAGSLAAFWVRARIMRGSMISGGAGASGEMAGAAREQVKAGASLLEAAVALKEAAAELRGRGLPGGAGPGGSPAGEDPKKPSSGSFNSGRGILAALGLAGVVVNAPGMDEAGDRERDANASALESFGEMARKALGVDWMQGKVDEWRKGGATAPSSGGAKQLYSAPAIEEDRLTRARQIGGPSSELKKDIQDGSKAGIIAGLRELAQQQQLDGGGSFGGAAPGHGGHAGMPNLRYGRPKAGGGYRHGPGADGGGPEGAFNPRAPDKAGTYRPQYKLSDADLSDYVVNTVNGEATSSAESMDAVINNMMNRVGSKGWGPSGNLRDVASAPGQYAGHRPASAKVAERIRDRIRAIASGGVPDNTNGSNAYRAAWYHGKWAQQHATDGRVVGGNRFAYEPWTKNGPYAPYPASKTSADAFAARQKALQGTPPGHRSGGWISGPGGPTADRIPAMLSNGEFVVQAKAAGQFLPLLHAINNGGMSRFANGGRAGRGSGITPEGRGRIESWMNFFMRPDGEGGMGASRRTALGAIAMMQGESGRNLDPTIYQPNDIDGPSGGSAQWHDVTKGRMAGKLRRFSDLMDFATAQHADWKDIGVQQAFWKKEARSGMKWAWDPMRRARTAPGTLKQGIDKFENPAHHDLEMRRRLPNIAAMVREHVAGLTPQNAGPVGPLEVNIRHHPHTGHPIVTARAGKGVRLGIRTAPMMRPT